MERSTVWSGSSTPCSDYFLALTLFLILQTRDWFRSTLDHTKEQKINEKSRSN